MKMSEIKVGESYAWERSNKDWATRNHVQRPRYAGSAHKARVVQTGVNQWGREPKGSWDQAGHVIISVTYPSTVVGTIERVASHTVPTSQIRQLWSEYEAEQVDVLKAREEYRAQLKVEGAAREAAIAEAKRYLADLLPSKEVWDALSPRTQMLFDGRTTTVGPIEAAELIKAVRA